jgi:hypothetical protein
MKQQNGNCMTCVYDDDNYWNILVSQLKSDAEADHKYAHILCVWSSVFKSKTTKLVIMHVEDISDECCLDRIYI